MRSLVICFFAIISSAGLANPIVMTHPIFIASERLTVTMGADAAQIEGRFHFQSAAKPNDFGRDSDVRFEIPIWIPADAKHGDASISNFYKSFSTNQHNTLDETNRDAWNAAINLSFTVGKKTIPVSSFSTFDCSSKRAKMSIPDEWLRDGYSCILATVYFPSALLRRDPEVTITYRQPLRKTRNASEFYYVPDFDNLPEGIKTSSLDQYSMIMKNVAESRISLGTVLIPSGYSAILPLRHHEAIITNISKR